MIDLSADVAAAETSFDVEMVCWTAVGTRDPVVAVEKGVGVAVAAEMAVPVGGKMDRAAVERVVPVVGGTAGLAERADLGEGLAVGGKIGEGRNHCHASGGRLAEAPTEEMADWAGSHGAVAQRGAEGREDMGLAYAAERREEARENMAVRTVVEETAARKVEALVARNSPSAAVETAFHLETLFLDLSFQALESLPFENFLAP